MLPQLVDPKAFSDTSREHDSFPTQAFFMMSNASLFPSQEPLLNDPQLPCGSPKLANLISEIGRFWQASSNTLFSYAFPHAVPIVTVWKFTRDGLPPNSSNKTSVFSSAVKKDLGTWYLKIHNRTVR